MKRRGQVAMALGLESDVQWYREERHIELHPVQKQPEPGEGWLKD
jgi:hypothetical protein